MAHSDCKVLSFVAAERRPRVARGGACQRHAEPLVAMNTICGSPVEPRRGERGCRPSEARTNIYTVNAMAAFSACVQDEKGMQIGERVDFSSHVLPGIADVRFLCLRYIDHYGDTIFNHLQIADLLSDFQLLFAETNLPDRHLIIRSLENLAEQSLSGVHLYLKFIGD